MPSEASRCFGSSSASRPFEFPTSQTDTMKTFTHTTAIAALAFLGVSLAPLDAQEAAASDAGSLSKEAADAAFKKRPYSPYADRKFRTRPFFGDTHLHTSFSMAAGAFGCRLSPRDAYRFARG